MATSTQWLSASRPRTLPAAVAPVLIGSGAAAALGAFSLGRGLLALLVSLALQVGVNYANDYSDGVRGTDTVRVGPMRLVGSGAAEPRAVKLAAFGCFAVAGLAGLVLAAVSSWWLVPVGAVSVLAAWFYTGGSRPYGYRGLGEVFVFVFFGLVAVLGTTFAMAGTVSSAAVLGAVGVGLLACALLMVNNLRDVHTDGEVGKRTLAVRLGEVAARRVYALMLGGAFLAAAIIGIRQPWALLALLALPLAWPPVRTVLRGGRGRDLIVVLGATGRLEIVYAALLTLGLVLSR
ncbi:1,4-dihydroxy-2-naphthoate polyprenyltransferase [Nakamurella flavida]|uniref:1,4-dihydroxy-2-naphthoate octaprenyltransferase n=1 Tax=Nakamurella flavida TaxID=363630 RepID=A0A938YM53_9ACTN|nr:1,4-dihydroxy-2-naphthoate polyprenyltransferase [Nakamurella flavida]MBM9475774.1 1,4-dihydroxy-2-naphthoate polyprenyltransferase [Nakamurella flavida]MDP9777946.1 1,4-dihydroxy-2-naphthoate octaprenyltransferase [Nakamurella flavida]